MRTVLSIGFGLSSLSACQEAVLEDAEEEIVSDETACGIALDISRKVDVLIIVDNSHSMADAQARLVNQVERLIDGLEAMEADYRIGVTTTDVGHPLCDDETTPERGALVAQSCRGRMEEFTSASGEEFSALCDDACPAEHSDITLLPTHYQFGGPASTHAWIESSPFDSNLPPGLTPGQALRCFLPQGVRGCEWESPLEALSRAIEGFSDPGSPNYRFHRFDALFAPIILSDELDCAVSPGNFSLFEPDPMANAALWSNPGEEKPTNAFCWNAGVSCTKEEDAPPGTPYLECHATNINSGGSYTVVPGSAVLVPVGRYAEELKDFHWDHVDMRRDSVFSIIAGVPVGFSDGEGLLFQPSDDPNFEREYGIGPGCEYRVGKTKRRAIPPLRLLAFIERISSYLFYTEDLVAETFSSICAPSFAPAIDRFLEHIEPQLGEGCYPGCPADLDPEKDGLQADCSLEWHYFQDGEAKIVDVPQCHKKGGEPQLSPDHELCYFIRSGDDLPSSCQESGDPRVSFDFLFAPEALPLPTTGAFSPTCRLSDDPAADCP